MATIILDSNTVTNNIQHYKTYGKLYYPLKCWDNKHIIDLLKGEVDGFLISEVSQGKNVLGFNRGIINMFLSIDDLEKLYKQGVRYFTFHGYDVAKFFTSRHKDIHISVRLSLTGVSNQFSFIGSSLEECHKILDLDVEGDKGISLYLPTDISLEQALGYITGNIQKTIDFISLGGISDITKFDGISEIKNKLNLKDVILEPGRGLFKGACTLEANILSLRNIHTPTVVLDASLYSGLLDSVLLNKTYSFYLKDKGNTHYLNTKKTETDTIPIIICGGSGDSRDVIGKYYIDKDFLEKLAPGVKLYSRDIGGYEEAFQTRYGKSTQLKVNIR